MLAIADVAVVVKDAKASAKWWRKHLGFAAYTVGPPGGHALLVAPPGDRFVLHLCEGFAPQEPGNTGIAFVTDGLDRLASRMMKGGVAFPEPPTGTGPGRMAKFSDPDGNVFWLVEVPTPFVRATLKSRAPSDRKTPAPQRARARRR